MKGKWSVIGAIAGTVLALDLLSKWWALGALRPGQSVEFLGEIVPFTLAFNTGAAFGLTIGPDPRWVFIPVTLLAVGFLLLVLHRSEPGDRLRIASASLVLGGALGNLYDRIRWERGVVDFIGPIDLGFMLWPIFNVADMAITVGAIALAVAFWREDLAHGKEGADRPGATNPARATGRPSD